MISDIKKIQKKELETIIKENEQKIVNIKEEQLNSLQEEKARLTSPDIVRTFSWFQKHITQRSEYKKYIQTGIENQAKLPILQEDIAFCENKIADAQQQIGNAKRKNIEIQAVNSLEDLEIKTWEEAKNLLKSNNKQIILEKGDQILTQIPFNFRNIEDFCFIYKTSVLPTTPEMHSKYEQGGNTQTEVLIGETPLSMSIPNWEKTLHGTINSTNHDLQSKYAVLSPFEKLDKSNLISAIPNDTFFNSSVTIPENSYILVPQDELDLVSKELQNNSNINIIGYNNTEKTENYININNALSILMNNLGYVEQELDFSGWENMKAFHDFQLIVSPTLEDECKIDLEDIIDNPKNFPFEKNRFLPFRTTKYLVENSKIKQNHCFVKALEHLHKNIKDFNVTEKKLKTKTKIEYDTEVLKSDQKNKSEDCVDDVFGDFISILKTRDIEKIDNYLESVDKRYIPDKKTFRDELLKSTSRLKKDGPVRNAFFSNIFQRFQHLKIKKEKNVEESIPNIPKIRKFEGIEKNSFQINVFGEIIRDSNNVKPLEDDSSSIKNKKTKTENKTNKVANKKTKKATSEKTNDKKAIDNKTIKSIENLQKIAKTSKTDNFEIIIEPKSNSDIER